MSVPSKPFPLARETAGLDACVHCGFCLQSCPTYLSLEDENDSPRGRIVLMRRVLDGDLELDDPDISTHIDRCLGCRACETSCPSGVPYGRLLEATRASIREVKPHPLKAQLILAIFKHKPIYLSILWAARAIRDSGIALLLTKIVGGRKAFPFAMLNSTRPVHFPFSKKKASNKICTAEHLTDTTVFEGCVMKVLFSHTNTATIRVLERSGFRYTKTSNQTCCGALHAHAGDLETARLLARKNIQAFELRKDSFIAVNSAGCGSMMREYGHLLQDDQEWKERAEIFANRVRDISELVTMYPAMQNDTDNTCGIDSLIPISYDPPCHLLHAQRISTEANNMIDQIRGVKLVPHEDADQCCGSAGIYSLLEPEVSEVVLAPKIKNIEASGSKYIVSGNPGCLMQLGAGLQISGSNIKAVHPVDLLDASL